MGTTQRESEPDMRASPAGNLRALTARDVMRNEMVTVVPEMTVRELAHTLLEAGIRSVPVLGPAGKVMGVASQADVTRLALRHAEPDSPLVDGVAQMTDGLPDRLCVRDVMGPVGPTVPPGAPLRVLLRLFVREHEPRALVVENDILLGIVTPVDVLGAIDQAP
jgi:CBS domain-containing protein